MIHDRLEAAKTIQVDKNSPINYAALAMQTEGYTAGDMGDLVMRAVHLATIRRSEEGRDAQMVCLDVVFFFFAKSFTFCVRQCSGVAISTTRRVTMCQSTSVT
jgi:hypothetical protein